MRISLLKLWVRWRRFRRGERKAGAQVTQFDRQIEALMSRANPFASWDERSNWIIDIAEWVRREPALAANGIGSLQQSRQHRMRYLLDWLDVHRDTRRLVRAAMQKTLREAAGPELFCATGLPREPAFFSELSERIIKSILPRSPAQLDLSALFTAMFPKRNDADWLLGLDQKILTRIGKLCTDDGIALTYRQQIDEALLYLVTIITAVGISHDFRQRLEPRMPLQSTPFMTLRRELEAYLLSSIHDEAALRSVRMLIAVCQAQTDRIYAHLDEYGVSVSLVYSIERMRSQLARMARLIDLRAAVLHSPHGTATSEVHMRELLVDLIAAHHHRSSIRGLVRRSFSMLARKMVERNADHGEHYIARNHAQYRAMLKAACRGGFMTAFTIVIKQAQTGLGLARFFEGVFLSLNYAVSFLVISSVGGVLATKQPAVTATALASKMGALDTVEGLRALVLEIAWLLRSQAAAVFGNLIAVIPTMAVISLLLIGLGFGGLMPPAKALASIDSLSIAGLTPLFAVLTGVLLWLSSLAAGFSDNWFALRRLRDALTHHRRLVLALGPARAGRWAQWLENNIAGIVGNVSLGVLLGMTPVVSHFFGLPIDVRHVTLSTGTLVAAVMSLDWQILSTPAFWLAVAGIMSIGLLNVSVAFVCSLSLALNARDVPARVRRVVLRTVWRRFMGAPWFFILPGKNTEPPEAWQPSGKEAGKTNIDDKADRY